MFSVLSVLSVCAVCDDCYAVCVVLSVLCVCDVCTVCVVYAVLSVMSVLSVLCAVTDGRTSPATGRRGDAVAQRRDGGGVCVVCALPSPCLLPHGLFDSWLTSSSVAEDQIFRAGRGAEVTDRILAE